MSPQTQACKEISRGGGGSEGLTGEPQHVGFDFDELTKTKMDGLLFANESVHVHVCVCACTDVFVCVCGYSCQCGSVNTLLARI